jgi:hypothetical protein
MVLVLAGMIGAFQMAEGHMLDKPATQTSELHLLDAVSDSAILRQRRKRSPGRQRLAVDNLQHMGVECLHL